jgi:lipoprotein Spr
MGVSPEDIKNVKLYKFIDDWFGAPYQYGGKSKTGVDCSGFVSQLYANVYGQTLSGSSASIHKASDKVSKKNLQEGDLVFFKISSDQVSHIGVYLQNNRFVHASTKRGVVINSLQEEYYTKYYFSGGRIP